MMNSSPIILTARKILTAALAAVLILAILVLLAAIWMPGLIVHQLPPDQQIVSP
jgi:hypothetical protein